MGFEVSLGMDDEIPIPGTGRGYRAEVPGIVAGDSAEQGDDDLCGVDQPRPYPYADRDTAADLRVTCGPVSEGEEFAPTVVRVQAATQALLGPTLMGTRVLGSNER